MRFPNYKNLNIYGVSIKSFPVSEKTGIISNAISQTKNGCIVESLVETKNDFLYHLLTNHISLLGKYCYIHL